MDAEELIRKEFFPRSSAALDAKDVEALTAAVDEEHIAAYKRMGEDAGLFSYKYNIGLRRIRAISKYKPKACKTCLGTGRIVAGLDFAMPNVNPCGEPAEPCPVCKP